MPDLTTPPRPKAAVHRIGCTLPNNTELRVEFVHDMAMRHWCGFAPTSVFKLQCMGKVDTEAPPVRFPRVDKNARESSMHVPFLRTVAREKLSPTFVVSHTADKKYSVHQLRPDGGADDHPGSGATRISADVPSVPFDWHKNGLMIEFKVSVKNDPFYTAAELKGGNVGSGVAKTDDESVKVLGQLVHYASELFVMQHRTHAFQLLVIGNCARYLYWDRSGAIVSERFDYTTPEGSKDLADFFWRFNHMSHSRRGWDMTASEATPAEADLFKTNIENFVERMKADDDPQRYIEGAEHTLDPKYPAYKIAVKDHHLIVQRPFQVDRSPCGRGTRAYLAYDTTAQKVVFLKDSWRVDITGLSAEELIYNTLGEKDVPFLPSVIAAEDVSYEGTVQRTFTQDFAKRSEKESWRVLSATSRRHTHHRIIQDVAYHLSTAVNSKEFTQAFRDVLSTMKVAHEKADYIHRDISINNIMLDAAGKAVLNDWDHAAKCTRGSNTVPKPFRTGTWQFMSIALLKKPDKAHELIDDLESIFWVYVYGAAKYIEGSGAIVVSMADFDERRVDTTSDKTQYYGGRGKTEMLGSEKLLDLPFACQPVKDLIQALLYEWFSYYNLVGIVSVFQSEADLLALSKKKEALSDPSFWIAKFDAVLKRNDWELADIIKDRFPPQASKVVDQAMEERRLTTILASEHISPSVPNNLDSNDPFDGPLSPLPAGFDSNLDSAQEDVAAQPPLTGPSSASSGEVAFQWSPDPNSNKRTISDRENQSDTDEELLASAPLAKRTRPSDDEDLESQSQISGHSARSESRGVDDDLEVPMSSPDSTASGVWSESAMDDNVDESELSDASQS